MKKISAFLMAAVLALSICACGSAPANNGGEQTKEPASPPDLTGEWKQVNSNSEDTWQAATISGSEIIINWVSDNGDTKSLYWAGTFVAPHHAG